MQPSAFSRYVNALVFPGLPQLLMRPFVFQDALVGAVLMLFTAMGWINLIQAHFGSSSAAGPHLGIGPSSDLASYVQYWPLLLHFASLVHVIAMK